MNILNQNYTLYADLKIINEHNVVIYDEIGWDYLTFHSIDLLKNYINNNFNDIAQIEFLNVERAIILHFKQPISGKTTYWFRDISLDLLNFLCQKSEFFKAIKSFFMSGQRLFFSPTQYPFLAAVVLGDISVDINNHLG